MEEYVFKLKETRSSNRTSNIVGKPLAQMLLNKNATVTIVIQRLKSI